MRIDLKNLTDKKKRSLVIANLYSDIGMPKHSYNVATCQNYMRFLSDKSKKNYKNINRNGCKDRFCSNCQRAYYLKNNAILSAVAQYLGKKRTRSGKHSKYSFLFITLTVPNAKPTARSVSKTQCELKNSVRRFLNLPGLKGWGVNKHGRSCNGRILGALAKFEQTVNHHNLSLNVHCHVMALIHSDYYIHYYLGQDAWNSLWCKACGHHWVIDVEAPFFKDRCGRRHDVYGFSDKAIKEMSKYETKSQDFLDILKDSKTRFLGVRRAVKPFKALVHGMSGSKRYISYGLMRKLLRSYKLKAFDEKDVTRYFYKVGFRWNKSRYNSNFVPLTDEEKIALLAKGIHTTPLENSYLNSHLSKVVKDYVENCNKEKRCFLNNHTKLLVSYFKRGIKVASSKAFKDAYNEYVSNYQHDIIVCRELNNKIMYNTENPKKCFAASGICPFSLGISSNAYVRSLNKTLRTEFYNYFHSAIRLVKNVIVQSNQSYSVKNRVISLIPRRVNEAIN